MIPCDAEVPMVASGFAKAKSDARRRFQRYLPLAEIRPEERGWTTLTLAVIRRMGKPTLSLQDIYARAAEFAAVYPGNRNIPAKIRQQLQVLRDLGILSFEGRGSYRLLA
jgi:type II restriction enzyme